jgi:hypothetical protein
MLDFIFVKKFTRFFKSGLLVDFFFKKILFSFLSYIYLYCVIFAEKYFVEYYFFQVRKVSKVMYLYCDYFTNENFFSVFGVIILLFIIILFIII